MKINYKHIYLRTRQMLTHPALVWPEALKENFTFREVFHSYLFPVTIGLSAIVFLLGLIHYSPLQALGTGIINLISGTSGAWFTYLITREYLCKKLNYRTYEAMNLTVYSYTVYILFHSIGSAIGNTFIGQIFILFSFIFLKTLYTGIGQLHELPANHKNNILVITGLSTVFIPTILTQILMNIFRISEINI